MGETPIKGILATVSCGVLGCPEGGKVVYHVVSEDDPMVAQATLPDGWRIVRLGDEFKPVCAKCSASHAG